MPPNDNIPQDPAGWDRVARDYTRHITRFTTLHAADLLRAVQPHLDSARTVLDIACGPGAASLAYLSLYPRGLPSQIFIATDFSPAMLAVAQQEVTKRLPRNYRTRFTFQVEDAVSLQGIDDASVDLVLSVFGVFLVSPQHAVFAQIRRVLKPGGVFANAAWTALPSDADRQLAHNAFGRQFQQTVQQVVCALVPSHDTGENQPPPWEAWIDPNAIRKSLQQQHFCNITIHRTIHSTTFRNVSTFWDLVSKTCPFADLSSTPHEKLLQVKDGLKQAFSVGDDDVLFMIMSSNLSVCALQPRTV